MKLYKKSIETIIKNHILIIYFGKTFCKERHFMILSIKNLKKSYGKNQVLKNISFELKNPTILGLIGPNGAGKSTLINCIGNLISYDGQIEVFGISNKNPDVFKNMTILKDNRVLYPYLTGLDHLKFIKDSHKLSDDRLSYIIDFLKIRSYIDKKVSSYSLGMKQHLLLAMAIMPDCDLIIMDEPLNGLDPTSILKTREIITELFKNGKTVIISSHSLLEIDQVTNDILFIKDGKLIYENINDFKKLKASISFTNSEDLKSFKNFLDKDSSFEIKLGRDEMFLEISMNEESYIDFINILARSNLEIKNFQTNKLGAEDRYKEIFAVK